MTTTPRPEAALLRGGDDEGDDEGDPPSPSSSSSSNPDCAVCLQRSQHPVRLDCSHIFCFLCVKGAATLSRRCPMCRSSIPANYLDNPKLIKPLEEETVPTVKSSDGRVDVADDVAADRPPSAAPDHDAVEEAAAAEPPQAWFYEGHNGWWQYDERTSAELEAQRRAGADECQVLVAGYVYVIDLRGMVQSRRDEPARRRRIKRDSALAPKKGVAGIRLARQQQQQHEQQQGGSSSASAGSAAAPSASETSSSSSRPGRAAPSSASAAVRRLGEQMARELTLQDDEQEDEDDGDEGQ